MSSADVRPSGTFFPRCTGNKGILTNVTDWYGLKQTLSRMWHNDDIKGEGGKSDNVHARTFFLSAVSRAAVSCSCSEREHIIRPF